jgi:hypothetical protein
MTEDHLLDYVSLLSKKVGVRYAVPVGTGEADSLEFYSALPPLVKVEIHRLKAELFKKYRPFADEREIPRHAHDYACLVLAMASTKSQASVNLRKSKLSPSGLPDEDLAIIESLRKAKTGLSKATKDALRRYGGIMAAMLENGLSARDVEAYLSLKGVNLSYRTIQRLKNDGHIKETFVAEKSPDEPQEKEEKGFLANLLGSKKAAKRILRQNS